MESSTREKTPSPSPPPPPPTPPPPPPPPTPSPPPPPPTPTPTAPPVIDALEELRALERLPPLHNAAPEDSEEGVLTFFADGSLIQQSWGGAGVAWKLADETWSGTSRSLGYTTDNNEAEARAILEAFELALRDLNRDRHDGVVVYSDSQTILRELEMVWNGYPSRRRVVDEIIDICRTLSDIDFTFELRWVKGHHLSIGNHMADLLASEGAETAWIGRPDISYEYHGMGVDPSTGRTEVFGKALRSVREERERLLSRQRGGSRHEPAA